MPFGALRARVAADQVGTYTSGTNVALASGDNLSIPSSCSSLNIPFGAPVIAFSIDRPAAPTTALSRAEYRTKECGTDASGHDRRGTQIESRVVQFLADGTITPSSPDAGWGMESTTCIDDVVVAVTSHTPTTGGGTADLTGFAAIALRTLLEQQLQMDCVKVDVKSEMTTSEGGTSHMSAT